jgi:para-nitrobenzyl esterase
MRQSLFISFVLLSLAAGVHASDALVVTTADGQVRGTLGNGVREWKGIPYAAPPTGARRWAMPAAPASWSGIRDTSRFASACPQVVRFALTEASDNEDCLYLNVAVPIAAPHGANKHAVLIWIYGGAYVGGAANLYPIDYLARMANIVVVSINYRLGVFGVMPHPAFEAAHNGGLAFEDQRRAMRWVQQNIAAFGGDPGNVTIAGESAGASSVCIHLTSPKQSAGLFHRAIIQSVGCTLRQRTVAEGYRAGLALAEAVGCADVATALECLRGKPVPQLLTAQTELAARMNRAFAPSVGSDSVAQQAADAFTSGNFVRVPIINGGNRDEMRLYVGYEAVAGVHVTPENYPAKLRESYGDNAAAVQARYPLTDFPSAPSALGTVKSDYLPDGPLNNCLFLHTAQLASRFVPVYQYEFTDRAAPPVMPDPGFELGAVHSAELPYLFPNFSNKSVFDGPDLAPGSQRLAGQIISYWGAFARNGRPQVRGLPAWNRFRSDKAVLRLDPDKLGEFDAGAAHHCEFWRKLYPRALSTP